MEGTDLSKLVNKCIKNGIMLKDLEFKDPLESTVRVKDEDLDRLKNLAGHSYRMTSLEERGIIPHIRTMRSNITAIIGAFLLGAFIFYQGLFIAEIRVDGYSSITEEDLRKTMAEAGLYEGARKMDDYSDVKAALFKTHDKITWVSIFEDGRMVKVNIAEAGKGEEAEPEDKAPVNIVAARSGMIEEIIPLQGNAKVQKGDYVNEGDVLISGRYKYQSTDYSKGDGFFILYSHAKGQVYAKVPRQLEFYLEKTVRSKVPTGRSVPGLYIKVGDTEIDTAKVFCRYETAERNETPIIDTMRPLPITISLVNIKEVELIEKHRDKSELEPVIEAAVRQYKREEMKDGEEILNSTIEYSETKNLIKACVFMEVLEDIGLEKEIKVKKKEKTEKTT